MRSNTRRSAFGFAISYVSLGYGLGVSVRVIGLRHFGLLGGLLLHVVQADRVLRTSRVGTHTVRFARVLVSVRAGGS